MSIDELHIEEDLPTYLPTAKEFAVWLKEGSDADARAYIALTVEQAVEHCAQDDYNAASERGRPIAYNACDRQTGQIWSVLVDVVVRPSFVTVEISEVPVPPATHVLWGGWVLCGDLRLRGVPGGWPPDQRWISLKEVADGAAVPADHCAVCWGKVPDIVAGIRRINT